MRKIKCYITSLIVLSLCMTICAKNNRTYRCHHLFPETEYYKYKTEVIKNKRGRPSIFNCFIYGPEDTVNFINKFNVNINNGIREECIYLRDRKKEESGLIGWYECTTEKNHNLFYKKIEKGYKKSSKVLTNKHLHGRDTISVLTPEARATYRKLIKALEEALREEDKENMRNNQIPILYMNCDIDENGKVIYWYLSSAKSIQKIISIHTFRRIVSIMRKIQFPKTQGLKKKFLYSYGTEMRIFSDIKDDQWNDVMFGAE